MAPQIPTRETPFNLAFKAKVVFSIEIGKPTTSVEHYSKQDNPNWLRMSLDLLEEIRSKLRSGYINSKWLGVIMLRSS